MDSGSRRINEDSFSMSQHPGSSQFQQFDYPANNSMNYGRALHGFDYNYGSYNQQQQQYPPIQPTRPITPFQVPPSTAATPVPETEFTALHAEVVRLKAEVACIPALKTEVADLKKICADLSGEVAILHKAVTGDEEHENINLRPFDTTLIRNSLIIQLRIHNVGTRKVDVAKALHKAIELGPARKRGMALVSYYSRKTYEEIFGKANFPFYSTSKKTTTYQTRKTYIAVPTTLPNALVELFCDAYSIVGDINTHYFAVHILKAVKSAVCSIFQNARRHVSTEEAPEPVPTSRRKRKAVPGNRQSNGSKKARSSQNAGKATKKKASRPREDEEEDYENIDPSEPEEEVEVSEESEKSEDEESEVDESDGIFDDNDDESS